MQQVAQLIKTGAKRPTDLAARFGGEEFIVVFADTEIESAERLVREVVESVEAMHLPHPNSETSPWVTLSAGVASAHPSVGTDPQSLIATADAALYRAKDAGRNRVERMALG